MATFPVDDLGVVSKSAYMLHKSLGERLAELRHEAGLSLRELGEKVGASAPHVRDVEIGNRQPSEALVEKMAAALGTDLDDLLKYSTRPPSRQMEELIEQDTQYSLAFRKFVDAVREKNIPPSEILDLTENLPNKKEDQ
ncbi:MAG: XRE family transcriptional regulator [Verrucomicrobia bacterium]|nr:MAG: XRE family transcriptional regulator [Verrucomicrobiota bacterium]